MSANSKYYRDHLYRLREHPEEPSTHDGRDSFVRVYLSLIPFLVLEYYVERTSDVLPSGLVFPMGFLLFWAFYYTYYRPGLLEDRLSTPKEWNPAGLFQLLFGVAIWFMKVTVVELSHLLLLRWVFAKRAAKAREAAPRSRPQGFRPKQPSAASSSAQTGSWNTRPLGASSPGPKAQAAPPGSGAHGAATPKPPVSLPPDVVSALAVLGLPPSTDWNEIHKRYRELAKKFHPDLSDEVTELGRRFIRVDQAYRKLNAVKGKYFEKRA